MRRHIFRPFVLFVEKCLCGNVLCAYGADPANSVVPRVGHAHCQCIAVGGLERWQRLAVALTDLLHCKHWPLANWYDARLGLPISRSPGDSFWCNASVYFNASATASTA